MAKAPRKPAAAGPKPAAKRAARTTRGLDEGDLLASTDAAGASGGPPAPAAPVDLSELIGQAGARRLLEAAIRAERVHHAWIFHGPPGIGKCTAARAFGAMLLTPADPAGAEPVQRLLRAGAHPDLHLVSKELASLSADTKVRGQKQATIAKEVVAQFLLAPAASARRLDSGSTIGKVFVVDEAELLAFVTQNQILKTLEEPPSGTVILLVTSDENRLLPTIRSRCQRVAFTPLSPAEMEAWIARAGLDLPPRDREWILQWAAGSPGAAQSAVRHGLPAWRDLLEPSLAAVEVGGGPALTTLGAAMARLVDERATDAVKSRPEASKDGANRLWSRRLLAFVASWFARRLREVAAADPARAEALARAIDLCRAAERQVEANVAFASVLENLAAQLDTPEAEALLAE